MRSEQVAVDIDGALGDGRLDAAERRDVREIAKVFVLRLEIERRTLLA